MSTTVTYKGNTLATFSDTTKKLLTSGKYLEDDISITDVLYRNFLPASAELVATATDTLNLSADTSYDSWTPSTTNTSILEAGSARAACNYKLTTNYQTKGIIGACLFTTNYAYTGAIAKNYSVRKIICGIWYYAPSKLPDYANEFYGNVIGGTMGRTTYMSSATATAIYASTAYGIGCTGTTFSVSSATSATSRTVGFTRPIVYARTNSSYFSTTAANALDSANTTITMQNKLWLVDKEEIPLYGMFDNTHGIFF